MLWDSCNPQLQIVKTALPTQGAAALCPALQAAEQLERTCELSLLGACFVSLSEPVVSWEENIWWWCWHLLLLLALCCLLLLALPSYPPAPGIAGHLSAAPARLSVLSGTS